VVARSKALVYGHSVTGIAGSNPAVGHGRLSLVSVACCQIQVSASGWSLVKRSPSDCGVSECDRKASIWADLGPLGLLHHGKEKCRQENENFAARIKSRNI